MLRYDSEEMMPYSADWLHEYGHDSTVWHSNAEPTQIDHIVAILGPHVVSSPCWQKITAAADRIRIVTMNFPNFRNSGEYSEAEEVYEFFFADIDAARAMALLVQDSARNTRKNASRQRRLQDAGGFHDIAVVDRLFDIQEGRCYYSGDELMKSPQNYVKDHIVSVYCGGTNWPENLALAIKEINAWKGGTYSADDTLKWLAKERGAAWLKAQRVFCTEVDRRRRLLHLEYLHRYAAEP